MRNLDLPLDIGGDDLEPVGTALLEELEPGTGTFELRDRADELPGLAVIEPQLEVREHRKLAAQAPVQDPRSLDGEGGLPPGLVAGQPESFGVRKDGRSREQCNE